MIHVNTAKFDRQRREWSPTTFDPTRLYSMSNENVYPKARVLVLVHGFNSNPESVARHYSRIEADAKMYGYRTLAFYWPSSRWAGMIGFSRAVRRTEGAAFRLRAMLNDLAHLDAQVVVQGHSLGARVVNLARLAGAPASRWVLTAAAFDYRDVGEYSSDTRVLYSPKDSVLRWAYRAVPSNWGTTPLGLSGLRAPGFSLDCSPVVGSDHSGYTPLVARASLVDGPEWVNL